jgi:hypothetical protein
MVDVDGWCRVDDRPVDATIDERAARADQMRERTTAAPDLHVAMRRDHHLPQTTYDPGFLMSQERYMADAGMSLQVFHATLVRQARVVRAKQQLTFRRSAQQLGQVAIHAMATRPPVHRDLPETQPRDVIEHAHRRHSMQEPNVHCRGIAMRHARCPLTSRVSGHTFRT